MLAFTNPRLIVTWEKQEFQATIIGLTITYSKKILTDLLCLSSQLQFFLFPYFLIYVNNIVIMLQILQAQNAELSLDTKGKEGIHLQVLQIHSECLSQINKDVYTGIYYSV